MSVSLVRGGDTSEELVYNAGGRTVKFKREDFESRDTYLRILNALDADPTLFKKYSMAKNTYRDPATGHTYYFENGGNTGIFTKPIVIIRRGRF